MNIISHKSRGILTVISGPSGAGKDTVCNELQKMNKNVWISVSATSREPRNGEVDGVNYFFLSKKEFEEKINNKDFLEFACYADNYYGTPKSKIEEKLNSGIDVLLIIEIQGALKVKRLYEDALFIFIVPPTFKDLKTRLENRKTETQDQLLKRFKRAYQEINEVTKYNYVVVNDEVELAAKKINAILLAEKCSVNRIEDVYLENEEEEIHELLIDKDIVNEDFHID